VSLSLKDIKEKVIANRQEIDKQPSTTDKAQVLRPWQNFKHEKDLVEIITNRKNKKNKVKRKSIDLKNSNEPSYELSPEELLGLKIKKRALALFGEIPNI